MYQGSRELGNAKDQAPLPLLSNNYCKTVHRIRHFEPAEFEGILNTRDAAHLYFVSRFNLISLQSQYFLHKQGAALREHESMIPLTICH